jgi:hypothetical protein
MYSLTATVNYPDDKDIETPTFDTQTAVQISTLVHKLLREETDATSFVITIVKAG